MRTLLAEKNPPEHWLEKDVETCTGGQRMQSMARMHQLNKPHDAVHSISISGPPNEMHFPMLAFLYHLCSPCEFSPRLLRRLLPHTIGWQELHARTNFPGTGADFRQTSRDPLTAYMLPPMRLQLSKESASILRNRYIGPQPLPHSRDVTERLTAQKTKPAFSLNPPLFSIIVDETLCVGLARQKLLVCP